MKSLLSSNEFSTIDRKYQIDLLATISNSRLVELLPQLRGTFERHCGFLDILVEDEFRETIL